MPSIVRPAKTLAASLFGLMVLVWCFTVPPSCATEPRTTDAPLKLDRFPKEFKWCVATAAHQIEGHNLHSDWWEFEKIPGVIHDGNPSGDACDHWNRLEEDSEMLSTLGANQYRFSVEWAKIEPVSGQFDSSALEHYRSEIALLKSRGIQPFVTLHHFVLPKWVADQGGFAWAGLPEAFERYSRKVYASIGSEVDDWTTLNEPQTLIAAGYIEGVFPPRIRDIKSIGAPIRGMVRAHARAYHALHEMAAAKGHKIRVGIAHHLRIFEPARKWNPVDRWITRVVGQLANWALIDAVDTGRLRISIPFTLKLDEEIPEAAHTQDFIGLNYYSRDLIAFDPSKPGMIDRRLKSGAPVTDLNWEIYPEGIYRLLRELHGRFPGLSILITENGVADHSDHVRESFTRAHLEQVLRAMSEGIPVEGYCHWTLMDNYEWAEGFAPRFGLFENDHLTQQRTLRPSGRWFSRVTRTGELQ
jgi:beta-glucosidase